VGGALTSAALLLLTRLESVTKRPVVASLRSRMLCARQLLSLSSSVRLRRFA
jgi:hypothetical protein